MSPTGSSAESKEGTRRVGMTEALRVENLKKSFGDLEVLQGIDLGIEKGETVVVLGASGSVKSTLLRCTNFLEIPTAGRIYIDGTLLGTSTGGVDTPVPYRNRKSIVEGKRVPARVDHGGRHYLKNTKVNYHTG